MLIFKIVVIPTADSDPDSMAKFTKGKKYDAISISDHSPLYEVKDDNGSVRVINADKSYHLGGNRFEVRVDYKNAPTGGYVSNDIKLHNSATGGVVKETCEWAFDKDKLFSVFSHATDKDNLDPDSVKLKYHDDKHDALINAAIRGGIGWAIGKLQSENFMREPFARIAELEKQVDTLTGERDAALNTIEKVREIMRSEPGYDIQAHARALRAMADALVRLQK